MEKLRTIEQFKSCNTFVVINGENVTMYEFLCVHPHNEKYILALEKSSMEGKKLYIPNLLGETTSHGEVYVGEFDSKFIASRMLEWAKRRVAYWERRLEEISNVINEMIMKKQFDLNYYLEHPETKVVTRDGRNVRILCTDLRDRRYKIVATCISSDGNGDDIDVGTYTDEGKLISDSYSECDRDLFFDLPDPIKKRRPLTYEDLLERVKAGKTLFVVDTTEEVTAQIVTFSADKVAVVIRGKIHELSYRWMLNYYFMDGDKCWKEVETCGTCTNDKGCVTCNDGDQWKGGEE